jgi:hypothetical protein
MGAVVPSLFLPLRVVLRLSVCVCVVLAGCASTPSAAPVPASSGWNVFHEKKDRRESLSVSAPGQQARTVVVRTPYRIKRYLISTDGNYLAYLTNEYGNYAIFVQHRTAELRVKCATVKDSDGELEFGSGDKVTYRSKKEDISIRLTDVREKLKQQFGFVR